MDLLPVSSAKSYGSHSRRYDNALVALVRMTESHSLRALTRLQTNLIHICAKLSSIDVHGRAKMLSTSFECDLSRSDTTWDSAASKDRKDETEAPDLPVDGSANCTSSS